MLDLDNINYDIYWYTSFIFPLAILGVCLVSLLGASYAIILVCWPFKKKIEDLASEEMPHLTAELKNKKFPCWTPVVGALKLMYGTHIKECRSLRQQNVYIICGRHVRPWLLILLFTVVIFVMCCTGVSFWCNFIAMESNHCEKHMDCFAFNGSKLVEINGQKPLLNCSVYESDTSHYDIHCFKFLFDYSGAIGDAGGIIIFASVIMNIQAGLWITASSMEGKVSWGISVAAVTIFNIVVVVCAIATPIIVHTVPLLKTTIINTDTTAVKFYTYLANFLFTSGAVFIVFSKRLRFSTEIDGEEQYISTASSRRRVKMSNSAALPDSDSDGEEFLGSGRHSNGIQTKYGSVQ